MTTPDTLSILRARLIEMTRNLSLAMSEVGGMVRIIDECDGREHGDTRDIRDHGETRDTRDHDETRDARDAGQPMVGRGVYRGIAGAYWTKGIEGTDGDGRMRRDNE